MAADTIRRIAAERSPMINWALGWLSDTMINTLATRLEITDDALRATFDDEDTAS